MKLVILDRDGVINVESEDYIKNEAEWEAIPGSLEAIARLNRGGFRVVVATNQSGLAREKFDIIALAAIHRKMHNHLAQFGGVIEAVFFCPHGPDEGCTCRKPQPGLLHEISRRLRKPLYRATVIGDSLKDIEAAMTVKAKPILVRTGHGLALVESGGVPGGVPVYEDLAHAADALLSGG